MPGNALNPGSGGYLTFFVLIFILTTSAWNTPPESDKRVKTVFPGAPSNVTPVNLKIAFTGDTDVNADAAAVLTLALNEGAEALVHNGDLGYGGVPQDFEDQINSILGENYPYFYSAGNHDDDDWYGPGGYKELGEARMNRLGIPWDGDYGVRSSFIYKGIFIILTAPDVFPDSLDTQDHHVYIREQLAADNSIWRISSWHKNMKAMQVYDKGNETGWEVYEESRKGGAIITTGHAHTYSRTYQMSDLDDQVVSSTSDTIMLIEDIPETPEDEGNTFVHVTGLGGRNIKPQVRDGEWWASVYTSTQNATYGALFGVFNYDGDPRLAYFYFKNIDGEIIDEFYLRSTLEPYTLNTTVSPLDAGTVSFDPPGGFYNLGTTVSLTATPAAGFTFDHWEGDLSGSTNPDSILMDGDKSISATFAPLPTYTCNVTINGSGTVDLNPAGGIYIAGTAVELIAVADSGWAFSEWGGDLTGTANPDTIIVDSSKNVTATFIEQSPTGISVANHIIPLRYHLYQNYPNPFNPGTIIKFDLPQKEFVLLTVYDMTGREVKTLINRALAAGQYRVDFSGAALGSGIYLYRLQAGSFQEIKKMILLK